MQSVKVDLSKTNGKIKPMNAVNNGPAGHPERDVTNFADYKKARIPYARLHDASFCSGIYGGEYSVDVHRIFPNFDADENNPDCYIFTPTDKYLKFIVDSGTKVFYRLGASIEHAHKRGTFPPKDYLKWARICERIIMHYTQGWANGFYMDIEYWEIWNEPDCGNPDGSNPCWQGTQDEFIEFFCTSASYLKQKFPNLKIGGPAFCNVIDNLFADKLLKVLKERNIKIDFFSYHCYENTPEGMKRAIDTANMWLEKNDYKNTETILNEWNYIKGWVGKEYTYSMKAIAGLKGASFLASVMCMAQSTKLDMLMYYDARPSTYNGLFDEYFDRRKGYYSINMFSDLIELGKYVPTENSEHIYSCGATDGKNSAIMLCHYDNDDNACARKVEVSIEGLSKNGARAEIYLLDGSRDCEKVEEYIFDSDKGSFVLVMENFSTYLVKIR